MQNRAQRSDSHLASANRPIIAGVDGTERSADAIALGNVLAQRLAAPLMLVYSRPAGANSKAAAQYQGVLQSILDGTADGNRKPKLRIVVGQTPAAGLQKTAEREQAQMIVVGPSHRSGLGRVQPGSVGERLLSGAPAPVGIAPRGYSRQQANLERLAAAFDGSPESDEALRWAAQFAVGDSRLRLISVHNPMAFGHISAGSALSGETVNQALRRDLTEHQAAAITAYGDRADGALRNGDPVTVLVDESRNSDLLVMGSRGHGPLPGVLLGSVSQAVIRHAACPVVVVPRSATQQNRPRRQTSRFPQSRGARRTFDKPRARSADGRRMRVSPQTPTERGPHAGAFNHDDSALRPLRLDERCLRVLRGHA